MIVVFFFIRKGNTDVITLSLIDADPFDSSNLKQLIIKDLKKHDMPINTNNLVNDTDEFESEIFTVHPVMTQFDQVWVIYNINF